MAKAYATRWTRTTMDTVIKRISEIEKAAVTVMDDAAARKESLCCRDGRKDRQFDQTAEEETEKK